MYLEKSILEFLKIIVKGTFFFYVTRVRHNDGL